MPRKQFSWKRVAICIVVLFIVLEIGGRLATHTVSWWAARDVVSSFPRPLLTPLSDETIAPVTEVTLIKAFGWSFSVPNTTLAERSDRKSTSTFKFADGSDMLAMDAMPEARELEQSRKAMISMGLLSEEEIPTAYDFVRVSLRAEAKETSFWHPRINARTLLFQSAGVMIGNAEAIYPIQNDQMKGFLTESRTKTGEKVKDLHLFDRRGHGLWLVIHQAPTSTQRELNALIASIRPPQ